MPSLPCAACAAGAWLFTVVVVSVFAISPSSAQFLTGAIAICDTTGQGNPNLVTGGSASATLYTISGQTGKVTATFDLPRVNGGVPSSITCADFRSRGYQDVAVHVAPATGAAGRTTVVILDGATFSVRLNMTVDASLSSPGGLQLASGDVDGDGEMDLVVASGEGAAAASIAVYNGTSGSLRYGPFNPFAGSAYADGVSLATVDLGADGTDEIVIGQLTASPLVRVVRLVGSTFAPVVDITAFQSLAPYATAGVRIAACAPPPKSMAAIVAFPSAAIRADAVKATSVVLVAGTYDAVNRTADVTTPELRAALDAAGAAAVRMVTQGSQMTFSAFNGIPEYKSKVDIMGLVYPPLTEAYVAAVDARAQGASVPSLAGFVFAAASGESAQLCAANASTSAWKVILQPPFFVAPRRRYKSPYYIAYTYDNLTADFATASRGNSSQWAADPQSKWYLASSMARYTGWGPQPALFPPLPSVDALPPGWLRERYIASLQSLVGKATYQHHHVPNWVPSSDVWRWNGVLVGAHSAGLDCSDFTSWGWNFGIGMYLTTAIAAQAMLQGAPAQWNGLSVAFKNVSVDVTNYDALVATLLPADMLYVRACPTCSISHVISWLGYTGRCRASVAQCPPLVIDSTGQGALDSLGISVPTGPNIRPFVKNTYYFLSLSHVVRVVQADGLVYSAGDARSTTAVGPRTAATTTAARMPATTVLNPTSTTTTTTTATTTTTTAARMPATTKLNPTSTTTTTASIVGGRSGGGGGSATDGTASDASSSPSSSGVSAGAAAGAAIGGVVAVAAVAVCVVLYRRRTGAIRGSYGRGSNDASINVVMNPVLNSEYRSHAGHALNTDADYVRKGQRV